MLGVPGLSSHGQRRRSQMVIVGGSATESEDDATYPRIHHAEGVERPAR